LGAAGVADGVGGWAAEGVDAAIFARRLMAGAVAALEAAAARAGAGALCVREALTAGHAATRGIPGSSTAVVAAALPGGTLRIAVLGDSGFHLLRGGRSALASDPQQHAFNMPFQLADPALERSAANTPADADVYDVAAAPGDVLVLATDGVWDNLRPAELEALLASFDRESPVKGGRGGSGESGGDDGGGLGGPDRSQVAASALAARIAAKAAAHGADPGYKSPWVVEAARAGLLPLWARLLPRGGKMDDCTVVVGWLVEARA
jgi:protein phosphatase PTC7